MSADARRFAQTVLAAFEASGRTTDHEVGLVGGPSTSTMTKLRNAAKGQGDLAHPRSQSWRAFDAAANWPPGTAKRVWEGGEPDKPLPLTVRAVGDSGEDLVEFTIEGNFGVRAVVKGPIRDMDALQSAVSKLISDMQIDQ